MSLFDELDAVCQAASETLYGERVRILPRLGGQYAGDRDDPQRPAVEVTAVFEAESSLSDLRGEPGGEYRGPAQLVGEKMRALISVESAASIDYKLKSGDIVIRLDKPGEPKFRLSWARPDNGGALQLALTP